jgi:hypothetical protein
VTSDDDRELPASALTDAEQALLKSLLGRRIADIGFDLEHETEQWVELGLDDGRRVRIGGRAPLIFDDETIRAEQEKGIARLRVIAEVLAELEIDDPGEATDAELAAATRLAAERIRAAGLT